MKVRINRIKFNEPHHHNIWVNITFSYDDRNSWIRTCQAEIYINMQEIKSLPFDEIEKLAVCQTYRFLEETIAHCDPFSKFPVATIEL